MHPCPVAAASVPRRAFSGGKLKSSGVVSGPTTSTTEGNGRSSGIGRRRAFSAEAHHAVSQQRRSSSRTARAGRTRALEKGAHFLSLHPVSFVLLRSIVITFAFRRFRKQRRESEKTEHSLPRLNAVTLSPSRGYLTFNPSTSFTLYSLSIPAKLRPFGSVSSRLRLLLSMAQSCRAGRRRQVYTVSGPPVLGNIHVPPPLRRFRAGASDNRRVTFAVSGGGVDAKSVRVIR
ncbi:hypothetical protein MRX96_033431 [Rhipicephalus microplus]